PDANQPRRDEGDQFDERGMTNLHGFLASFEAPSLRPFPTEYFNRRTGHVDLIVALAPFEAQVAAGEMRENLSPRSPGEDTRNGDGAGAGAAGQSDAAAALPGAHGHFLRRAHRHEMDIDAPRKDGSRFDLGADLFERDLRHVAAVEHRVRIAHRDTGD